MKKISLCIAYFNRSMFIEECFNQIHDDERIDEIIIQDDCSSEDDLNKLMVIIKKYNKIKLFKNEKNIGPYCNKLNAVKSANNEYIILLDSDNIIDKNYIDVLYNIEKWIPKILYCPSFAKPRFNYKELENITFNKDNIRNYETKQCFLNFMNTGNFFLNKYEYLNVCATYNEDYNYGAADCLFLNYLWLLNGNTMFCTPNLEYSHRIHPESTWCKDGVKNAEYANEIWTIIKNKFNKSC